MRLFRQLGAIGAAILLALAPARAAEQSSYVAPIAGPMTMATFAGTYLNPALRALASCSWGASAPTNGPGSAALPYQCWADTTTNPVVFKVYDGAQWVTAGKLNTSTHAWTPSYQGTDLGNASTGTIGSTVQAWDADLDALAALSGTDTIYRRSGAATWSAVTIGGLLSFSGGTLNVGDAELVALAGLTSANNKCFYFTGAGTSATFDCSSFGRSVANAADAAALRTLAGVVIGTDVQAYDADLAALAANATSGLWARTGAGTGAARTITAPAAGISVSNGDGVAGNPTLALANDLAGLEGMSCTGVAIRSATDTWLCRTVGGTANEISVANGDGVAGAPTLSLPAALTFTGKTITGGTFSSPTIAAGIYTGLQNNQGAIRYSTQSAPAQVTANQNDYNPSSVVCASSATLLVNSDAARDITGMAGGVAGCEMRLVNNGSFTITLKEQSGSSTAANRFNTGGDITLAANAAVTLLYDGTASRWRMASPASAGGGGGSVTSVICNGGATTITTSGTCASREVLSGARTYYVRTDGNDNCAGTTDAGGSSGACAFLTVQKAINVVATLDIGTNNVTIQVRSGTFAGGVSVNGPWLGSGTVTLVGDNTTPSNVTLSSTTGRVISAAKNATLTVSGFKVTTTGSGTDCVNAEYGATITISNKMEYGACVGIHLRVLDGGRIIVTSGYTISGGASNHIASIGPGCAVRIQSVGTITLTGTPAFSTYFAQARYGALIAIEGNTFSGSGTGPRYYADLNGVINTAGGGASYLPGDSAGSTATQGQYI